MEKKQKVRVSSQAKMVTIKLFRKDNEGREFNVDIEYDVALDKVDLSDLAHWGRLKVENIPELCETMLLIKKETIKYNF